MKDLIRQLENLWGLVQSQSSLIDMQRNREIQMEQQVQLEQSRRAAKEVEYLTVINKLSSASVETDQWEISRAWNKNVQLGMWPSNSPELKQWLDATNAEFETFWVEGSPGSGESPVFCSDCTYCAVLITFEGKTVLASRVVAEVKNMGLENVAYFYFKEGDMQRDSFEALLKSLLVQILHRRPGFLHQIQETLSRTLDNKFTVEVLLVLVELALESIETFWLILDGLDECSRKERKKILSWVTRVSESAQRNNPFRVLCFSQNKADILDVLFKPSLCLGEMYFHQEDVRAYAYRKIEKLEQKFELDSSFKDEIKFKASVSEDGNIMQNPH